MDVRNTNRQASIGFFTGSAEFDCRKRIWQDIFRLSSSRMLLCDVLDLDKKPNQRARVKHMAEGDAGWDGNAAAYFLALANSKEVVDKENPLNYRNGWLDKITASPVIDFKIDFKTVRKVLCDFVEVYPACDWPEAFKQVGKQVRDYLTIIIARTETLSVEDDVCKEYLAAGLYSLMCLFLQNLKQYTKYNNVKFYRPAAHWDPVMKYAESQDKKADKDDKPVVVTLPPQAALYAPEAQELPFDFFAHVRAEFEKQTHIDEAPPVALATVFKNENVPPVITPAEVHRKRVSVNRTIPMMDSDFSYEGVFSVEDVLVTQDGKASLSRKLHSASYTMEAGCRICRVQSTVFEDDQTDCILSLGVAKDPDDNGPYNSWACCIAGDWEYRWKAAAVYLDEAGNRKDLELEHLLAQHGIGTLQEDSPAGPRMAVTKLDPEYLNYFIVNAETMTEIPKFRVPGTGDIAVTLPCPGTIAVVKCPTLQLNLAAQDRLFLQGYLHGCYGLKQDTLSADVAMATGIHDPHMAFQYGAMMKDRGDAARAEPCLRQAAQAEIPGAVYELAELLTQQGKKEEAAALIQSLLDKGYRSYGEFPITLV